MPSAWALLPIKCFALAKSRLAPLLTREECARLAEEMTRDVLRALTAARDIAGITLLSDEDRLDALAESAGAELRREVPGEDYRAGLSRIATDLRVRGVRRLLVLHADLPTLSSRDLEQLLADDVGGVTVCAAADGGTNAVLLSPPDVIRFRFGPGSAAAHLAEARSAGVPARTASLPGFTWDIDTPEDLRWLLTQKVACATLAWLAASGLRERLRQPAPPEG